MSRITAGVALVAGVGSAGTVDAADWSLSGRGLMLFDNLGDRDESSTQGNITQAFLDDISPDYQDALGDPNARFTLVDTDVSKDSSETVFPLTGVSLSIPVGENIEISVAALSTNLGIDIQNLYETQIIEFSTNGRTTTDIFSHKTTKISDISRIDVEAMAQIRRGENFAYLAGVRVEHLEEKASLFTETVNSSNYWELYLEEAGLPPSSPEDRSEWAFEAKDVTTKYDVYSLRFGGAAFTDFEDDTVFYVNFLGFVSYERTTKQEMIEDAPSGEETSYTEYSIGPDISVGFAQRFGDNWAVDVRYRSIASLRVGGEEYEDPRISHGVSFSLTRWF